MKTQAGTKEVRKFGKKMVRDNHYFYTLEVKTNKNVYIVPTTPCMTSPSVFMNQSYSSDYKFLGS